VPQPAGGARASPRAGFLTRWVGLIPALARVGRARSTALLLVLARRRSPAARASDSGNDPPTQTTRHAYDLLAAGFGPASTGLSSSPSVSRLPVTPAGLDAIHDHAKGHARDRLRRGAAAQPRPRHAAIAATRRRRRRATRRRVSSSACAAMSCRRSRRQPARNGLCRRRDRDPGRLRACPLRKAAAFHSAWSCCCRRCCCWSSSARF